jgi:hypothetical protein
MTRNGLLGALAFGVQAAIAGYIWTAYEFPFAILLPAAIGWFVVSQPHYGSRKALWAALVGGVTFLAAFLVAVFFALTDGSPIALSAWLSAVLAAAAAGAATGWVLGRSRGALAIAGFSAVSMLVATAAVGLMRAVAPATVDVAGPTQFAYFALTIGLVGAIVGAGVGAGVAWLASRKPAGTGSEQPLGATPSHTV